MSKWKCKANPAADPPQDCDYPNCGCGEMPGAISRAYHWLMIWPCLWIGALHRRENWFSDQSALHWLKSRKFGAQ